MRVRNLKENIGGFVNKTRIRNFSRRIRIKEEGY
jgi:hypothetical protein